MMIEPRTQTISFLIDGRVLPFQRLHCKSQFLRCHSHIAVFKHFTSMRQGCAVYTDKRKVEVASCRISLGEAPAKKAQTIDSEGFDKISRLAVVFMTRKKTLENLGRSRRNKWLASLTVPRYHCLVVCCLESCSIRVEDTQVGGVSDKKTEHVRDAAACRGTSSGRLICQNVR